MRRIWAYRDGKVVEITGERLRPRKALNDTAGPMIMPDIEPYRDIAIDGKWVTSRSHRREKLKAHGMVEVGNDAPAWLQERLKEEADGKR